MMIYDDTINFAQMIAYIYHVRTSWGMLMHIALYID